MRLPNEAHWLRYKKVVEGANVSCLEVVVENGHRKKDLQSVDGVGGDERQARYDVEAPGNLVEDTNLTEEPIQSLALMCSSVAMEDCRRYSNAVVNNDFDVGTYENDEWEQEEEDNHRQAGQVLEPVGDRDRRCSHRAGHLHQATGQIIAVRRTCIC